MNRQRIRIVRRQGRAFVETCIEDVLTPLTPEEIAAAIRLAAIPEPEPIRTIPDGRARLYQCLIQYHAASNTTDRFNRIPDDYCLCRMCREREDRLARSRAARSQPPTP